MRNFIAGLVAVCLVGSSPVAWAQVDEVRGFFELAQKGFRGPRMAIPRPAGGPVEAAKVEKEDAEPEAEPTPRKPRAPLPPKYIVLNLLDGSTVAGDLSVETISVKTEFGELVIPISKLKSFTPGLDSNPAVAKELDDKLKALESDDYQAREQAHKDLAALGPKILKQLAPHASSENPEVKRHVTEILKEFEQLAEEGEEEESEGTKEKAWINEDTIETLDFTVIGKISPPEFELTSKYGPLTVSLGDVVRASRPLDARDAIQRNVTVSGQNLAQRSFKSTGIRLHAGDRVTITASGNVTMTPWGGNAVTGPDGMANYGWYVPGSIPGGALVYRIGDKGQVQKAGARITFTAKSSGTLQLAVGVQSEYAGEGNNFPGEYKAKVKVTPN
jgi:hypothetical protein